MTIGIVVVVTLLCVNGWLSYLNIKRLDDDASAVEHTQEVLDELAIVRASALEGVANYRHFIVSGVETSLGRMATAFGTAEQHLDVFAKLTADNPQQQQQIPQLRAAVEAMRDQHSQTALLRKLEGFEAAQAIVTRGDGQTAVDRVLAVITEMDTRERDLLSGRRQSSARTYRAAVATSAIATVAALAAVALFGWLVRRFLAEQADHAAAIDEQRQVLQATLTGIGDGVIATDAQCRVTFLNPVAEMLTGWKQSEAAGRSLEEVFHIVNEDTRQLVTNPAARALADGRIVGLANHTVLIAKDQTERAIDDSAAPIHDRNGHVRGAVLVFRDVSDRRSVDRALAERAKLAAFELELVVALSRAPHLQGLLNETASVLVRHLQGSFARVWVLNEHDDILELWATAGEYPTDDTSHDRIPVGQGHKIGQIAATRSPTLINRVIGDPRVQDQQWAAAQGIVAFAGYPLAIEDRVIGVIGMFSKRALSAAMLDVMAIVATTIALAIERIRKEEALRDADRRKDEFLAMLGHELRNPLAGIVTGVDVLKMLDPRPEVAEMQAVIDRQAAHMSHIVDDLLDVSRIARGKLGLRRSRFDLCELVRHVVEDYNNSYILYDCEVVTELPACEVWVEADRTRMAQVVTNLVHNGCKFCDGPNRVAVTLEADHSTQVARVAVSDRGIGMSPETLRRVFEPFHQADTSLARSRGGLGLGLALVKGIVDLHQGQIRATSGGLGCGTRVEFTVPLSEKPAELPLETNDVTVAPRRVLLIDDRRDAILPVQKMLSLDGHEVATANDGPVGLDVLRAFRPEVVLCDIGLTGSMSGYDVVRVVRSESEVATTYMVAVTGYGQEEDRRTAQAAGFDYHVTKPVSRDQLRQLMTRMPRFEA